MPNPTHVPVLLDRVVALVAPALERPGAVFVDATLGLGGHSEAVLDRCPQAHLVGIDRDQHALDLAGRPARTLRGPDHPRARGVRRDPRRARRARHRGRRRDPLRPRRLLDAARRPRARVRLRGGRTAGHADGRHRGPDRGRRAQRVPRRRPGPDPPVLRRGEVRPPDRTGDREGTRDRPVHRLGPAGRPAARDDPGTGAAYRGTPGQAHLPGAADRGQRRARRPAPGDPRRDRLDPRRWTRRGDELPVARGPAGQAGVRERHHLDGSRTTCPSSRPATSRRCAPSPAGPRRPPPRRSPRTRAPPPSGCAPSNASTATAGETPQHEHLDQLRQGRGPHARPTVRRGRRRAGPADRGAAAAPARPHPGGPTPFAVLCSRCWWPAWWGC